MSEQVERRLIELLGHPTESPYGNPIPGLDELGLPPADAVHRGRRQHRRRASPASDEPVTGVVRRLGEPVQFEPELLAPAASTPASCPGAERPRFSNAGPYVLVQVDGVDDGLELPSEVAGHIFVGE